MKSVNDNDTSVNLFTRKKALIVLLLIILLSLIRFGFLAADPPWKMSFSMGIWTDGAQNAHAARNKILFGKWQMDTINIIMHSPLWTYLQYIILQVIGIGFWQIKILPVVLSISALILFYFSFKEHFGFRYAFLTLFLLGTNYMFIMYNRLSLHANLLIFFMALTIFFYQKAIRYERNNYFVLSGISTAFVFIAQNTGLYFVAAICLTTLIFSLHNRKKHNRKSSFIHLTRFLLGLSLTLLIYFLVFWVPNRDYLANYGGSWVKLVSLSDGFIDISKRAWRVNVLWDRLKFMPFTLALAGTSLLFVVIHSFKRRSSVDYLELLFILWIVIGVEAIGFLNYSPPRYYIPIVPALIALASLGICKFWELDSLAKIRQWNYKSMLWAILSCLYVFVYFVPQSHLKRYSIINRLYDSSDIKRFVIYVILSLTAIGFVGIIISILKTLRNTNKTYAITKNIVVWFLIILISFHNGRLYILWAKNRRYKIVNISRELGEKLPPGSLIAGIGCMPMVIENKLRCVLVPHTTYDGKDLFTRYNVTHLCLSRYANWHLWYQKHYPLVLKYSKTIAVYRLWHQNFHLSKVDVPEDKKEEAFKFQ